MEDGRPQVRLCVAFGHSPCKWCCRVAQELMRHLVNFDEAVARSTVRAFHGDRVIARRERCQNGGFQIVRGRQAGVLQGSLLRVAPVVVSLEQSAVAVAQLKQWVRQHIWNAEISQRWSDPAQDYL